MIRILTMTTSTGIRQRTHAAEHQLLALRQVHRGQYIHIQLLFNKGLNMLYDYNAIATCTRACVFEHDGSRTPRVQTAHACIDGRTRGWMPCDAL